LLLYAVVLCTLAVRENGIDQSFDLTKVMFCTGNVTEKLRVAAFNCTGETVVDLYAGIG
jgi:tRNA G37 N-methylase Trm5